MKNSTASRLLPFASLVLLVAGCATEKYGAFEPKPALAPSEPSAFANYGKAMSHNDGYSMAYEWQRENPQAVADATKPEVLASFVASGEAADALLAKIGTSYDGDPLALTQIAAVTQFIEQHSATQFDDRFTKKLSTLKEQEVDLYGEGDDNAEAGRAAAQEAREQVKAENDASDFKKAIECIINTQRASTSHFQRKLGWGYNHSAKIMDMLEDAGVIGPQIGAGPRQIIMDQEQLLSVFNSNSGDGGQDSQEEDGQ